jgi:hypothetical protein
VLGIVGARYVVLQNTGTFDFVDQLLGSRLHFETAGSLNGGRRVSVLATLPDHIGGGGDAVRQYVLLMNSHDGSTAVIAATTPVPIVCMHKLCLGLKRARQRFSIRHTQEVAHRVHGAGGCWSSRCRPGRVRAARTSSPRTARSARRLRSCLGRVGGVDAERFGVRVHRRSIEQALARAERAESEGDR